MAFGYAHEVTTFQNLNDFPCMIAPRDALVPFFNTVKKMIDLDFEWLLEVNLWDEDIA